MSRYDFIDDGGGNFKPEDVLSGRGVFLVGRKGDRAVACGAFRPIQPDIAEIKRMFVIPECRSRGYSRAMLTELERRAHQNGYKTGGWRQVTGSRKLPANPELRHLPGFGKQRLLRKTAGKLVSLPCAQQPAQKNQFSDVVGIVVGHLERFAEQALAIAVREWGEQVRRRSGNKLPHGLVIGTKARDALVPCMRVGRFGGGGPVAGRPVGRRVFGIAAEFQHVPLRDSEVFEQFPGGVRRAGRGDTAQGGGHVGDCLIEIGVRASSFEQFHQLAA